MSSAGISSLKIEFIVENDTINLTDPIDRSPDFKKVVWFPYFKELYNTLLKRNTKQSDSGLDKFVLHSVLHLISIWHCLDLSEIASSECSTLKRMESLILMSSSMASAEYISENLRKKSSLSLKCMTMTEMDLSLKKIYAPCFRMSL